MQNIKKLTSSKNKVLYIVLYTISTLLAILYPYFLMKFIDFVVLKEHKMMIIYMSISVVGLLLYQLFCYLQAIQEGRIEEENYINYFNSLNEITKRQDLTINEINSNDLSQNMGQYYEQAEEYFYKAKIEMIFSFINIISIFVVMFFVSYIVALIMLLFIPISVFITKKFENKLSDNGRKNTESLDLVKGYLLDQNTITKEERFVEKRQLSGFNNYINNLENSYKVSAKTKAKYLYFFSYSLLSLGILITTLLVGYFTYQNILTIGALFAFQTYISALWSPTEFLMSYKANYEENKEALKRIDELLDYKLVNLNETKINKITIKSFSSLDKDDNPLFETINYDFKKGNIYLIKGENGSGKTTMIEAIMHLTNRYQGEILINNEKLISNDFVYVKADSFISSYYDEKKTKGSNGQKKLSQIELYLRNDKNALILDEPTNYVDEDNKQRIYDLIKQINKANKIIIIVSHDKEFNNICDKTILLNKLN